MICFIENKKKQTSKGITKDFRTNKLSEQNKGSNERETMSEFYKFFSHKQCEYFPCHKTDDPDNFNCLFCFCPLYLKGAECGGNFRYTEKGVKDCSQCMFPHARKNYPKMMEKLRQKYRQKSPNSSS